MVFSAFLMIKIGLSNYHWWLEFLLIHHRLAFFVLIFEIVSLFSLRLPYCQVFFVLMKSSLLYCILTHLNFNSPTYSIFDCNLMCLNSNFLSCSIFVDFLANSTFDYIYLLNASLSFLSQIIAQI